MSDPIAEALELSEAAPLYSFGSVALVGTLMMAPLDAIFYVGQARPSRLLFQSARFDVAIGRSDAQAFFDAASKPKQLK